MKKYLSIVLVAIFALVITGCGSKQTIKCSMSQSTTGYKMTSDIDISLKDSKFDNMNMVINVTIDDSYLSYKDMLVSSLESEFSGFEQAYGAKVSIKDTDKGAKITISMNREEAEKFYGSKAEKITKKEVIEEFEGQGYSCK